MTTSAQNQISEPLAKATLETLIDQWSLRVVCEMLAEICADKADHLQTNWQDSPSARAWQQYGGQLNRLAGKLP